MSNYSKTTTKQRTIVTKQNVRDAMRKADLSHEEERVLRMTYGIGEPESAALEFVGQECDQVSVKLAQLEAAALAATRPLAVVEVTATQRAERQSIIDRLKDL